MAEKLTDFLLADVLEVKLVRPALSNANARWRRSSSRSALPFSLGIGVGFAAIIAFFMQMSIGTALQDLWRDASNAPSRHHPSIAARIGDTIPIYSGRFYASAVDSLPMA